MQQGCASAYKHTQASYTACLHVFAKAAVMVQAVRVEVRRVPLDADMDIAAAARVGHAGMLLIMKIQVPPPTEKLWLALQSSPVNMNDKVATSPPTPKKALGTSSEYPDLLQHVQQRKCTSRVHILQILSSDKRTHIPARSLQMYACLKLALNCMMASTAQQESPKACDTKRL